MLRVKWTLQETVRTFLSHLKIVFLFNVSAYGLIALGLIITAQQWGPEEYARISLVGALSTYMLLPLSAGVHAVMYKKLPNAALHELPALMGSALTINGITAALFALLFLAIGPRLTALIKLPAGVWNTAIVASLCVNFALLSESFLRGQKKFRRIGTFKVVSSGLFFMLILAAIFGFGYRSFVIYHALFCASQVLFGILAISSSGKINFTIDLKKYYKILRYGFFLAGNMLISNIVFYSDTLIMNFFYSPREVGIFAAYQLLVKQIFIVLFWEVFAVVFLPTMAEGNRKETSIRLIKLYAPIFLVLVVVLSGVVSLLILFFGSSYPFNVWYVLLAASGGAFFSLYQISNSILAMDGSAGARRAFISVALFLPFAIGVQIAATRMYGIPGAIGGTACVGFALTLCFTLQHVRHFRLAKCALRHRRPRQELGGTSNGDVRFLKRTARDRPRTKPKP